MLEVDVVGVDADQVLDDRTRDVVAQRGLVKALVEADAGAVILVIVVVGVLLWALNSFVPMDSKVKSILNIVVVILLIVWLLRAFGLIGTLSSIHV